MCLFFTPKESANRKCKLRFSGVEFNVGEESKNLFFNVNITSYLALLLFDTTAVWYCCTSSTALTQLRTFFSKLNLFANNTRIRILHFNIDLTCHAKFQLTVLFLITVRASENQKKARQRGGRYKSVDPLCKTPPKKIRRRKLQKWPPLKGLEWTLA